MYGGRRHILDFYLPGDFYTVSKPSVREKKWGRRATLACAPTCHSEDADLKVHSWSWNPRADIDDLRLENRCALWSLVRLTRTRPIAPSPSSMPNPKLPPPPELD
jgi:hypothetical protein